MLELTYSVHKLKNQNHNRGKAANQEYIENRQDKNQVKNDIVHALKTLNELKEEREVLETATRKQEEYNQDLSSKN